MNGDDLLQGLWVRQFPKQLSIVLPPSKFSSALTAIILIHNDDCTENQSAYKTIVLVLLLTIFPGSRR